MKVFAVDTYPTRAQLDVILCETIGSALLMCFGCLGLYSGDDNYVEIPLKAGFVFGFLICAVALVSKILI